MLVGLDFLALTVIQRAHRSGRFLIIRAPSEKSYHFDDQDLPLSGPIYSVERAGPGSVAVEVVLGALVIVEHRAAWRSVHTRLDGRCCGRGREGHGATGWEG